MYTAVTQSRKELEFASADARGAQRYGQLGGLLARLEAAGVGVV